MTFEIELDVRDTIGYVMVQNNIGIFRNAWVINDGGGMKDVTVELSSEPKIFDTQVVRIDYINPFSKVDLNKRFEIYLDPVAISKITVRTPVRITVVVRSEGADPVSISKNTAVLPYNYWPGIGSMPETIAAFVVPNSSSLSAVRSKASDKLEEWKQDPSLEGYQGDRNRVQSIAAAVFAALEELNINYVTPPAGFENSGQNIRLPNEILANHEGTCIDLATLYASSLESIGINTMICILRGHALAAFWLEDDYSPDPLIHDSAFITKKIRNHKMMAVECTSFVSGKHVGFEEACEVGLREIDDADDFICAVDIRAARQTIKPLPAVETVEGRWIIDKKDEKSHTTAPKPVSEIYEDIEARSLTVLDRWKRDLLDITGRNPLINMKQGKKTVPILITDTIELMEALVTERSFEILSRPQLWDGAQGYERSPFEQESYIGNYKNISRDEMVHGRLHTPLSGSDFEAGLKSVYRLANKELEESGCNSLFVSIGVLRWYDDRSRTVPRYAPLILIPVGLSRSREASYTIKRLDEDIVFNVTLLERLKQENNLNIGIPDQLSDDDNKVDVEQIFQTMRNGISGIEGWDVLNNSVTLGVFSFSQYAMWKDLDSNFDILRRRSKIIDCLYENKMYPENQELTDNADPYGLCLTVPADGSQVKAVRAVSEGKSFLMYGPPGTGKSQTITNIISNELYNGRTVLFVAEKKAALEVVQKRLNEIGIGNHCLEMHSNKTERSKILEQLRTAISGTLDVHREQIGPFIQLLESKRRNLDAYVIDLHKTREWGLSAFECISRYEACGRGGEDIKIDADAIKHMDPVILSEIGQTIDQAYSAWSFVYKIDCDVIRRVKADVPTAAIESDAREAIESVRSTAKALIEIDAEFEDNEFPVSPDEAEEFSNKILSIDGRFVSDPNLQSEIERYIDVIRMVISNVSTWSSNHDPRRLEKANSELLEAKDLFSTIIATGISIPSEISDFMRSLEDLMVTFENRKEDMARVDRQWFFGVYSLNAKWPIGPAWTNVDNKGFLSKGKARKDFMQKVSSVLKNPSIDFKDLAETVNLTSSISSDIIRIDEFARTLQDYVPDWQKDLEDVASKSRIEMKKLQNIGINPDKLQSIQDRCRENDTLINRYKVASSHWNEAKMHLKEVLVLDDDMNPNQCIEFCDALQPLLSNLFDWVEWNACAERLDSIGLDKTVELIRSNKPLSDIHDCTVRSIYRTMIAVCREESKSLRTFSALSFENAVENFKELDKKYTMYNRDVLKYRLYMNMPHNEDYATKGSELSILYKAINSKRLKMSIRRLLSEIPNVLPKVCPCILMSPQSAAQYITMDYPLFDVVLFDESSQITTSKAIGALGRAKTAVIAGDDKQLPPTSFFQKMIDDDDEDTIVVDSFLEECLSLGMPKTHLEWHYRSRHESLIRFSNKMFYGDRMLTFPSPNDLETRVSMHHVDGSYIKGRRNNPTEAQAVVEEIRRRCMDPELRKQSIGVIAFGIGQQTCIQDALDALLCADQDFYNGYCALSEPLFIKNLETVQGDERDVILFSIGYGPDKETRIINQNFGPVNRDGGERRLNVAVTRARSEMIVFCSFNASELRLSSTSSKGLEDLKAFLEYAENNGTFEQHSRTESVDTDSFMLSDIAEELKQYGYDVHFDVGSSRFKVDAAVVDPDNPDRYILGILADGRSYIAAGNTRDREYARSEVLENLGWNLLHIWSLEWYYRKDEVIKTILNRIETLRSGIKDSDESINAPNIDLALRPSFFTIPMGNEEISRSDVIISRRRDYIRPTFESLTYDRDMAMSNRNVIRKYAGEIINHCSPISEKLLVKLYCERLDIKRLTAKNRSTLLPKMHNIFSPDMNGNFVTYWSQDVDKEEYIIYHVAADSSQLLDISEISLPELINAIIDALEKSGSISEKDMVTTVSRLLGYEHTTSTNRSILKEALEIAVSERIIMLSKGRYTLQVD